MSSFNRVILMGNLTRDPELRHTANDSAVANIGLAVNRRYRTKDGDTKEEVTFVDCEAWGRTAEVIGQYCSKGKPLLVEGRLKLDEWTDQGGQKRKQLRVVIENFQFVPREGGGGGGGSGSGEGAQRYEQVGSSGGGGGSGGGASAITEDEIPF